MHEYDYRQAAQWAREDIMKATRKEMAERKRARAKPIKVQIDITLEEPIKFLEWLGTGCRVFANGQPYNIDVVK